MQITTKACFFEMQSLFPQIPQSEKHRWSMFIHNPALKFTSASHVDPGPYFKLTMMDGSTYNKPYETEWCSSVRKYHGIPGFFYEMDIYADINSPNIRSCLRNTLRDIIRHVKEKLFPSEAILLIQSIPTEETNTFPYTYQRCDTLVLLKDHFFIIKARSILPSSIKVDIWQCYYNPQNEIANRLWLLDGPQKFYIASVRLPPINSGKVRDLLAALNILDIKMQRDAELKSHIPDIYRRVIPIDELRDIVLNFPERLKRYEDKQASIIAKAAATGNSNNNVTQSCCLRCGMIIL